MIQKSTIFFTDILADYESEIVINDLTMCYKKVFN